MRVLLSCLQSLKRHPIAAYEFWRPYFVEGCREAGIESVEVPEVDWAEGLVYSDSSQLARWRERTWERVLNFVRREHSKLPIQVFLGYLYPGQVEVAAIKELQRLGIPCVNFFCDNLREFSRVPEEYRPFDLHWVPEFEALPMYEAAGFPYVNAPMPCWVPDALRVTPEKETEPPTFIGSADALRRDLLGRALKNGANFIICGRGWVNEGPADVQAAAPGYGSLIGNQIRFIRTHGWRAFSVKIGEKLRPLDPGAVSIPSAHLRPAVPAGDYFRTTREACVTIGINRVPTRRTSNRRPLTYSRLRDIEAPMLGACYLTEWTAGIGQLYHLGTEVETYRTPEELADKLTELTRNPARRLQLRKLAQRRALGDHSVAKSLLRICERLSLPQP